MPKTMPALFLGHGSPMNAIEDNAYRRSWQDLGRRLPRPRAILCISAHWETEGVAVTASPQPDLIYDFYGFPKALTDVRYPAPGDPALARRVADLLAPERVQLDPTRGLDHGVWSLLVALYPKADIPVVQLSMPINEPGTAHLARAKQLAALRDEGVLILGSGNIVHNLRYWRAHDARLMTAWTRFHDEVKRRIGTGDYAALADYKSLDPESALSVPTPEHYLPLLYVLALHKPGERLDIFNDQEGGAIFMTSIILGDQTYPQ